MLFFGTVWDSGEMYLLRLGSGWEITLFVCSQQSFVHYLLPYIVLLHTYYLVATAAAAAVAAYYICHLAFIFIFFFYQSWPNHVLYFYFFPSFVC